MRKRFIPNDEQRPVVSANPDQAIFVQAGAGSGKTATLSAKLVNAISGADNGGTPLVDGIDRCLMGTFTDNAATEFKERVRAQLNEAGLYQEAAKVDGANIATIHTICNRFLSDNALDLGLDPEFEVMTEENQKSRSRKDAVECAVTRIAKSEEFSELLGEYDMTRSAFEGRESQNSIQGMLARLVDAITLSPAGVGSLRFPDGDPEELRRIAAAFERQAHETRAVLADIVSQAKKPSKAMTDRIASVERAIPVAADVARRAGTIDLDDLDELTSICSDIEALSKQSNRSLLGLIGLRKGYPARESVDMLNARYSHLRAEAHLLRARALYGKLIGLAESAIEEGDRIKDEAGVLDQNDLLRRTYEALVSPGSEVADRYRGRIQLAMTDEFQDTSRQQVEIMQALARREDGEAPDISALSTVGDTQQSIYRFRGANVAVMREAKEEAETDPTRMVATMSTNYRSHPEILEYVRATCDNGGQGDGILPDFVPLAPDPNRADDLVGMRPRVTLDIGLYDSFDEAYPSKDQARAASVARIARMFSEFYEECKRRDVSKPMALLLGVMTNVGDYAEALRRENIPYVIAGGSIFSKRPEVRAVADLMRAIADPGDTASVYRLLAGEMFCLGDDDFLALHAKLGESGRMVSRGLDEGLLSGEWPPSVTDTVLLDHTREVFMRAVSEAGTLPMSIVCENAIRRSGWLERLAEQGPNGRMSAANIMSALRHIRETVDDAGLGPVRGAKAFSEWLNEAKEPPATLAGSDDNPVQIMTIHASKGLQFSCVAVAEHNPETRMTYGGLSLSPDSDSIRVTLVPSEKDKKEGKGWQLSGGSWEQRAKVLRNFADAREFLGDDADRGIAAQTLAWREEEMLADEEEDGRLLYVALTRAEDRLMHACLAHPAASDLRKAGHDVAPVLTDRLIRGIETANEAHADDGRSVQSLMDDDPSNKTGLRIGTDMPMRFGKDGFGTVTISTDRGDLTSPHDRPKRIFAYSHDDEIASPVTVRFTMTTERDDE